MSVRSRSILMRVLFLVLGVPASLLMVACPHRSPVWSPDSKHILLLARSGDESVDRPSGGIWLIEAASKKSRRLPEPAPGVQYLAATWIDNDSFAVFTAELSGGEVKEGSEAIWKGTLEGKAWARLQGPQPSAERTPRRIPLVMTADKTRALVYASGIEAVVAVDLGSGKELLRIEPAELVGPGPGEGFLVTRPEGQTAGLELVAIGSSLKPLWTKRFSELAKEIAGKTGKKTTDIVISDTSTSVRLGSPPGQDAGAQEVGVTFVYIEPSWREGIAGYFTRFDGKTGALVAVTQALALPGWPGAAAGAAWAIVPAGERGVDGASIRSFPADRGEGARIDIAGLKKSAVHGYSVSPSGKSFAAVIAGGKVKLLLYPIEGQKIAGQPVEIELGG